ncbi:hypothetical protein [Alteromonas sp. a30]|uniref:hypothetical protein n=1 Tax=Alteromonas sp. a30 TaxID=2730917 RepID=UPI002281D22F|nr:hypothetical protein [Alteromonas sp. a30]MCY7294195.1 hypothetical protein [Alteromonas sp. a30]
MSNVVNFRFILIAIVSFILSACSSSSHVLLGKEKSPISPQMVVVYSTPPASYEKIAVVKSSSRNAWRFTEKGKRAAAMERLKEEAASLGANGLLIQHRGQQRSGFVSTGAGNMDADETGDGEGLPLTHETLEGIAIWVKK